MDFSFTVLGCSAAMPAFGRNVSAHIVQYDHQPYLLDCGEGTQIQLQKSQVAYSKIKQIFISHLHGDHYFGLFGLLTSFGLTGRQEQLEIFAPPGLTEVLESVVRISDNTLPYPLVIHEVDSTKFAVIWEGPALKVFSIPLQHRIPCNGFLFVEKQRSLNIIAEVIPRYNLSFEDIKKIKDGADFQTAEGTTIPNAALTFPRKKSRAFAYCSDTAYHPAMAAQIQGVDLLYHEATFDSQNLENARISMHSTASQAAEIAALAKVNQLIIGHFSPRYKNLEPLLREAQEIFENTELAVEGMKVNL